MVNTVISYHFSHIPIMIWRLPWRLPKLGESSKSFDDFRIETHGDLGIASTPRCNFWRARGKSMAESMVAMAVVVAPRGWWSGFKGESPSILDWERMTNMGEIMENYTMLIMSTS